MRRRVRSGQVLYGYAHLASGVSDEYTSIHRLRRSFPGEIWLAGCLLTPAVIGAKFSSGRVSFLAPTNGINHWTASLLTPDGRNVAFFTSALKHCYSTRHRASTSMYSITFCVRVMSPERHHWKPAVQTAAVMLRTPPSAAGH